MSGAFVSATPWIPEDDILLKNAVEAGASLLALAKGAVKFSRKFTLQELRDRWHSLLYDPDVSEEASSRMLDFENFTSNLLSKSNTLGNSKAHSELPGKMKVESIRRLYYAMKKKLDIEALNAAHLSSFVPSSHICIAGTDGLLQCEPLDHRPEHVMSDHDGVQETNYRNLHYDCPQINGDFSVAKTIFSGKDHYSNEMIKNDGLFEFSANVPSLTLQEIVRTGNGHSFDGSMLETDHNDGIDSSTAFSECDFADLPDSLLNFENEEEHAFIEMDQKKTVNLSPSGSPSSLLLCSPGVIPIVGGHNASASPIVDKTSESPGDACPRELDSFVVTSEVNVPQSVMVQESQSTELPGEFMICVLNTQDLDVPDNDDVVFPMEITSPHPPLLKSNSRRYRNSASTSNRMESEQRQDSMIKREYSTRPSKAPKLGINAQTTVKQHHLPDAERYCDEMAFSEHGSPISNLAELESDVDIPYVSDVEAMILDIDLGPCDQDSFIAEKVSRHHNEDYKRKMRKIMRLEQCANSSLQRALAFRGALAFLYGRHVKYYIRKAEVLLGRATDDVDVDIDLGREGQANKISRRQAIIKLERDGSFCFINVGRGSVFVNGKEIANGQLLNLIPSCLIEVRGLSFLFEVNQMAARRYARSIGHTIKPEPSFRGA